MIECADRGWRAPGLSCTLALAALLLAVGSVARAEEEVDGKYRVGERVECDFLIGGGEFRKGTVVKVEGAGSKLTCCRYRVKIDNDDPLWSEGRLCFAPFTRAAGASAATRPTSATPPAEAAKAQGNRPPAEVANFDYLADRPILDCPVAQQKVGAAARPQADVLRKVVRCLFERRAPSGMTGATTVDISAFEIGTPRKWRVRDDIGSGNSSTVVYPVKTSWSVKKFYESFTRVEDNISVFDCYVNAVGEWQCGLGQRLKDGEARSIPR